MIQDSGSKAWSASLYLVSCQSELARPNWDELLECETRSKVKYFNAGVCWDWLKWHLEELQLLSLHFTSFFFSNSRILGAKKMITRILIWFWLLLYHCCDTLWKSVVLKCFISSSMLNRYALMIPLSSAFVLDQNLYSLCCALYFVLYKKMITLT